MNLAGNPYGTYGQDEPKASTRSFYQKVLTQMAF